MPRPSRPTPFTDDLDLVLGGGGARGAYQAGLLRQIARHLDRPAVRAVDVVKLRRPCRIRRIGIGQPLRDLRVGPAVSVAAAGAMVATLALPHGALAGLSFFLFGAGPIIWTITTTTLRQSVTPSDMLGRVGAVFLTVNAGSRPVGAALGAVVGAAWGEAACLVLAFAGFVLQAAIILTSRLSGLKALPK